MALSTAPTLGPLGPLLVDVHWQGACAMVAVQGELDLATAPLLISCLTGVVSQRPRQLTLDLARLVFIDCAGLTPIVRARRLLPADRPLILRSPPAAARRLLLLTGLDRAFPVEPG